MDSLHLVIYADLAWHQMITRVFYLMCARVTSRLFVHGTRSVNSDLRFDVKSRNAIFFLSTHFFETSLLCLVMADSLLGMFRNITAWKMLHT